MVSETGPKPRRHIGWRVALAIVAGLIALLFAAGAWLFSTESGTRAAFSALASLTAGSVQAEGIGGRLASSMRIAVLRVETAGQRVEMKDLQLDWKPSDLLQRRLHVQALRIGHLSVVQKIREEKPKPAQLPATIALPFKLQIDNVQIDEGRVARGSDEILVIDGAAFNLAFDGERYRLGLDRLALRSAEQPQSTVADISGQATLSTDKPYPLDARFATAVETTVQKRSLRTSGHVGLGGSLAELAATIDFAFQQAQLNGQAVLRPFSEQPLGTANIEVLDLDLASVNPELPQSKFDLSLSAAADGTGKLELKNTAPGLYNNAKVPFTELQLAFHQEDAAIILDQISAALGTAKRPAGRVNGSGRFADGALTLALRTPELNLRGLDRRLPATRLSGKIDVGHSGNRQEFTIDFTEPLKKNAMSLFARGALTDASLMLDQAVLKIGGGKANLSGHVGLSGPQSFAAQGDVSKFRLQDLGNFPQLARLTLNGKFELSGMRSPELAADLTFKITDSLLAGNPLRGEGRAQLRGEQIIVPNLQLVAGANRLIVQGELSERASKLTFALQAPQLAQLGAGFDGAIVVNGSASGTIARPQIDVEWKADDVHLPGQFRIGHTTGSAKIELDRTQPFFINAAMVDASARALKGGTQQLESLSATIRFAPQPNAPIAVDIQANGISAGEFRADSFTIAADGTTERHTIDARLTEPKQSWSLAASGGLEHLAQAPEWQGSIDRFDASGSIDAKLDAPAPLSVSQQRISLDRFRLASDTVIIAISQFVRSPSGITSRGRIEHLQLAQLLKFSDPSSVVATDLQLDGDWDVNIADTINGTIHLRRTAGDVVIRGGGRAPFALGLGALQANIVANNGRIDLELDARGKRLGQIDVSARTTVAGGAGRFSIPSAAPLSGRVRIDVPTIAWAGPLISPTLVTEGSVQSEFAVGGTLAEPRLSGKIGGSDLRFYSADLGVDLRNGVLETEFRGSELMVQSLRFQNDGGQLTITGPISFEDGKPNANLMLGAERFMVLNQSDRRLTISGESRIDLDDGRASVTGDFTVNSGYFDIGRKGTPQLSDDVVIVGDTEESKGKVMPALDIRIGLGDGVKLEGRGLNALLVGEIRLQNAAGEPLQAYGSLRVEKGTYAAYGRELAIERGALKFSGPIANPALNILAMRRGQEVEAGVSVQGTVLAPRVTLVSEPSLPDAEKLSWLVLGRGLSGVGESELGSLQSAAGALLSQGAAAGVQSQIANAFGLDTLSVSESDDSLQQRIITLGKQLSSRLYVSYQQGLETASSAVLLRYTLSPRFSVEVEAGARSALSLFYNITFD